MPWCKKKIHYEPDAIILIALCLYSSFFNGAKREKQNKYDVFSPTIIRRNRGARLKAQHSAGITGSKMTHSTVSLISLRSCRHDNRNRDALFFFRWLGDTFRQTLLGMNGHKRPAPNQSSWMTGLLDRVPGFRFMGDRKIPDLGQTSVPPVWRTADFRVPA